MFAKQAKFTNCYIWENKRTSKIWFKNALKKCHEGPTEVWLYNTVLSWVALIQKL